MPGPELTHWTIRLALLCFAARLAGGLRWGSAAWWFPWSRAIWTAGCLLFLAHVACAFHFYHDWSHATAFESTATQTEEQLGMRFGEGIYFSYLFMLLWVGDAAWQWLSPTSYQRRSKALTIGLLSYMAFIAFNGAAVFEGGVTRWVGIPLTVVLLVAAIGALMHRRSVARDETHKSLVPGP
jgi:hypothetical protein